MPAARSHQQDRCLGIQFVVLAARRIRVGDCAPDSVPQINMALDEIAPGWRVGILKIRHINAGARIQGVDNHFAIDWSGDLDSPIEQIRGQRSNLPVALANFGGLRQKVRARACIKFCLPLHTGRQQLAAPGSEAPFQINDKIQSFRCQDFVGLFIAGAQNLHTGQLLRISVHLFSPFSFATQ